MEYACRIFSWKKRICLEEIGKRIGERKNDSVVMKIGVVRKNCEIEIKVEWKRFSLNVQVENTVACN